ncbi:hypothetical protein TeGR_g315, partial [Tetraparma gracilis]
NGVLRGSVSEPLGFILLVPNDIAGEKKWYQIMVAALDMAAHKNWPPTLVHMGDATDEEKCVEVRGYLRHLAGGLALGGNGRVLHSGSYYIDRSNAVNAMKPIDEVIASLRSGKLREISAE